MLPVFDMDLSQDDICTGILTAVSLHQKQERTTKQQKNMEQLNHKICIYVPSTFGGNKPAKRMQRKAVKKAAGRFSRLFGGATAQQANGFWFSSEKGLIPEVQTLVYSYCTEADKDAHLESVKTFAQALCRWMKQEAVSIEIDNTLQFIEA